MDQEEIWDSDGGREGDNVRSGALGKALKPRYLRLSLKHLTRIYPDVPDFHRDREEWESWQHH